MLSFDTSEHDSIRDQAKLAQRSFSNFLAVSFSDRVENFLVKHRHMAEATVLASRASFLSVLGPVKLSTVAHFAKITGKRTDFQEPQQREELSNSILHWCS